MASRRWLVVLVVGALGALGARLALRGRADQATAAPIDDAPAAAAPAAAEPRRLPPVPRTPPRPEAPAYKEEVVTSDGIPIAPPRGEVVGQAHPHPITPQHQRIYGENRLVGAIEGAIEVKDVSGIRRLLDQYRREYPEDDQQLQDGYAAIADCLEHPGAATRAAAERWLDSHNGSTAKRDVVRYCLEPPAQR
jgi:hypothetical protein